MSRHAKNNTASAVFTYHEKSQLTYGTQKTRLGKDSLGTFESCRLCINPAVEAMACLQGHMFCKACIYDYLLQQKQELKRQQQKYEAQQERLKEAEQQALQTETEKQLKQFQKTETSLLLSETTVFGKKEYAQSTSSSSTTTVSTTPLALTMQPHSGMISEATKEKMTPEDYSKKLTAFWVPSLTPSTSETKIQKPPKNCDCPEGKHTLRLKQLVKLQFTGNKDDNKQRRGGGVGHYQCPLCAKTLSNACRASFLKRCGHVFCSHCANEFLTKEGKCSVCNHLFSSSDVIPLASAGTGYAGHGEKLEAVKYTPAAWL